MKSRIIIGVIALIVVVLAGFVISRKGGSVATQTSPSTSATPAEDYTLSVITPTITLQKTGESTGTAVTGTVTVHQGDTITTSATGRARLRWPNGTTTTIESESSLVLTELGSNGSQSTLTLIVGDIWSKIRNALGSGEYYQVETQEAVAAVRGTVFRVSYHQHLTRVEGVEHTIRMYMRRADGSPDLDHGMDITENDQGEFDARASGPKAIHRRNLTTQDKAEVIYRRILREKDLDLDTILHPSPSVSPTPFPKVPQVTITPKQTASPLPSLLPTVTVTTTPLATLQPTATSLPPVVLQSVFPRTIAATDTFSLEGSNFTTGRNIPRVTKVFIGTLQAQQFSIIIGGTSIFVQPPAGISAGTYDVSVLTTEGDTVTLSQALTIQ